MLEHITSRCIDIIKKNIKDVKAIDPTLIVTGYFNLHLRNDGQG